MGSAMPTSLRSGVVGTLWSAVATIEPMRHGISPSDDITLAPKANLSVRGVVAMTSGALLAPTTEQEEI